MLLDKFKVSADTHTHTNTHTHRRAKERERERETKKKKQMPGTISTDARRDAAKGAQKAKAHGNVDTHVQPPVLNWRRGPVAVYYVLVSQVPYPQTCRDMQAQAIGYVIHAGK